MRDLSILVTDKGLEIGDYNSRLLKQAVKDAGHDLRASLSILTPEYNNKRRYVMGGLIPIAIFLDGNDYRDKEVQKRYFEFFKQEFTPEVLKIGGKIQVFGKSTKGNKSLNTFIEKLQDYLNEQHGLTYDSKATNPEEYKRFRDEIFPFQREYEDFIDYCVKSKYLKNHYERD